MVIQRSRKWVKDRIPAFICRETGWWVTRWIQCNVFLCPECRKEYRSLKSVWDQLDQWGVEDPEGEVESCFIQNFRQKFPGAYQEEEKQLTPSGFWVPRVAYLCAIALIGIAVLWRPEVQRTVVRTVTVESPSTSQVAEVQRTPQTTPADVQVAEAPAFKENNTPDPSGAKPQKMNSFPVPINLPPPGTQFRTTSTLAPIAHRNAFRIPLRARTIEINDMPVSGFESLTQPYEEERPY